MSLTRLSYDECAYNKALKQSTSPLNYMLYPGKFYNCSKCRIELGQVGGNNVSLYNGNLVDLESNLMGIDNKTNKCNKVVRNPLENAKLNNLNNCQLVNYRSLPEIKGSNISTCNYQ
jgi:hypothetical protein